MDALTALHTRSSANILTEPAPTARQLDNIIKAALRACDHRSLKPWKFLLIDGNARQKFGELMVNVKSSADGKELEPNLAAKIKSKPMRAPTIIAVVAAIQEHEKVPTIEQVLSAGAAAQMMMVAAHAQGLGAIWRSGSMMFRREMLEGLGLAPTDQIVGFVYLGTPKVVKPIPIVDVSEFLERWDGIQ